MEDRFRFRAWDSRRKTMVYNGILGNDGSFSFDIDLTSHLAKRFVLSDDVMQCTGLKDKNGKLIFEGDIVNAQYTHWLGNRKRLVVWDAERALFYLSPRKNEYDYQSTLSEDNHSDIFGHEIIGNIYQNPELMEDK